MDCLHCGTADTFNRVVVNRLTGGELGAYCAGCETEAFGALLRRPAWHREHGCGFCDGRGKYVLPSIECLVETDEGSPRSLEYHVTEDSPALCADHLARLLPDGVTPEDVDAADARPPSIARA